MNVEVPRLRTSNVRPSARLTSATAISIGREVTHRTSTGIHGSLTTSPLRRIEERNDMLFKRTLLSAIAVAMLATPVFAQSTPMKLPPGMTPAIMKMMMEPGPKHPAGLPADVIPVAGCIPTMGYHYSKPKDWPLGPIYGWYNGKPIFTEVMISKAQFAKGIDLDGIKAL